MKLSKNSAVLDGLPETLSKVRINIVIALRKPIIWFAKTFFPKKYNAAVKQVNNDKKRAQTIHNRVSRNGLYKPKMGVIKK